MPVRTLALLVLLPTVTLAGPPVVTDDRLVLELVAREPDIVTPTGLAVDEQGRVWVVENHTHHRDTKYRGHPSDRIRVYEDLDANGRARRISTFADGFKDAMSLAFGPDGTLYLATRSEIVRLARRGDRLLGRKTLVRLQTSATYPHNGLCGFAFDGLGNLHFGMGENLGVAYRLVGSDGTTLTGKGEGGNVFRCRPDGSNLARFATGFWNPFHHTFDALGRLFVVDNDPDARGPCRLLHVVEGGDHGYRFRYGRKGLHPFQCWDGELPGTLGMVSGTGEAPSGVLAYESVGLPEEYRGSLLVTSWGDHAIERYDLLPRGASFRARARTLVRGGDDFRPVALATGPDGAVYFSDWVDKSYPVHGKGRIWRLRSKSAPRPDGLSPTRVAGLSLERQEALLGHPRQEIRTAATRALASRGKEALPVLTATLRGKSEVRGKLHALWAAAALDKGNDLLIAALEAPEPEVRAEAARLVGLTDTIQTQLLRLAREDRAMPVRVQAVLRLRGRTALEAIVPLLADPDPVLVSAAIEVLGRASNVDLLLHHIEAREPRVRLGVLLGLRRSGASKATKALDRLLEDADAEVRRAAIQWVGEERLADWAGRLDRAATRPPGSAELFRALLASRHLLAGGKPEAEPVEPRTLGRVLDDPGQPPAFRLLALRLLPPDHPARSASRLVRLLGAEDDALRRQAVRMLATRGDKDARTPLLALARSDRDPSLRAFGVLGLASFANGIAVRDSLLSLLAEPGLRRDALRSLRGVAQEPATMRTLLTWWDGAIPASQRPELAGQLVLAFRSSKHPEARKRLAQLLAVATPLPMTDAGWQKLLARGGDPAAGERVFFHPNGPGCFRCHRTESGGETIGPDLSTIGRAMNRERLIESILRPGKEIAPRYVSWRIVTIDGKSRTGIIADEGPHSIVTLADNEGKLHRIRRQEIEERTAATTSIMPDRLHEQMTPEEFRDLVAYLESRGMPAGEKK